MIKDIKNFEDYQITDDGRVWSKKTNKWLKGSLNSRGYYHIALFKAGKLYFKKIHRLVAEAFIPNPDNKNEIDHINTVRTDNRVSNLRWVTRMENNNNPLTKKKMSKAASKKNVYQYTLDGELIKVWESTAECGRNGFYHECISKCCNGKLKTHKGFIWKFKNDQPN